jgi:hypothetical protein
MKTIQDQNSRGTVPLNNSVKINFSAKSFLSMNYNSRCNSLTKKIEGPKSRGTIPLTV